MKYTLKNTITSLDEILCAFREKYGENVDLDLSFNVVNGVPEVTAVIGSDGDVIVVREGDSIEI